MQRIPIKLLRPGDFFVITESPIDVSSFGFCISNVRYQGEGYANNKPVYGRHVHFLTGPARLRQVFWKEEAEVTLR